MTSVVHGRHRENESDLRAAAEKMTPETIDFTPRMAGA
jgi:3,4-dihydroxy-2-butanone 4-phosphate synthase